MSRTLNHIAVFCGSNFGNTPDYADGAARLGQALARAGITLVYGGTTKGLMGIVANAALEHGGRVHGVLTTRLQSHGHAHPGLTTLEVLPTLRERNQRMIALADAFIAQPGGIGTLYELMEVWTMNQLGEIDKPAGLLNTAGFFDSLAGLVHHMADTQFLPVAHAQALIVEDDPASLIERLRHYEQPTAPKWLPTPASHADTPAQP